jgi:hypothetical protein
MNARLMFDLRQIAVKFAAKADEQSVIGKFQQGFYQIFGGFRGGQRADAQVRLLCGFAGVKRNFIP